MSRCISALKPVTATARLGRLCAQYHASQRWMFDWETRHLSDMTTGRCRVVQGRGHRFGSAPRVAVARSGRSRMLEFLLDDVGVFGWLMRGNDWI